MHTRHEGGTTPYERHLDGLRAFAVLAVLTARATSDVNPKRNDCLASYTQTEIPPRSLCTTLQQDVRVLQRTKTGCAPLLGIDIELRGRKYVECSEFNRRVHEEIAAFPPGRVVLVVMAARWNLYFLGERDSTALRETPVLLVGIVPEFEWDVPACVSRPLHFGRGAEACNQDRNAVSIRNSYTNQALLSATDGLPTSVFVDPMPMLCERQVCLGSIDERTVLYYDKDHLTTEGARRLARWMWLQPGVSTLGLGKSDAI